MKKRLLVPIAMAGPSAGPFVAQPATADCVYTERTPEVIGVYSDAAGVSVEVYEAEYPVTVEVNTGQGLTYCSDSTVNDILGLLP